MMERAEFVIVVAGGSGRRMGTELPKQFLEIEGRPILRHTVERFLEYNPEINVIFALPSEYKQYWKEYCDSHFFLERFVVATGGLTRFHSVKNALEYVPDGALAAVHDGVRPLVSKELISRLFEMAKKEGSAIPAIPLTDSVRELSEEGGSVSVQRDRFVCVQTPQVFHSEILKSAYNLPFSTTFTDDASVVEAYGNKISLCQGDRENIKITTPVDLTVAGAILRSKFQGNP